MWCASPQEAAGALLEADALLRGQERISARVELLTAQATVSRPPLPLPAFSC